MILFGNLAARKDNINNVEETFTYDDIDRLTSVTLNGRLHSEMNYDRMGRMVRKQTDGKTVFNEASFHNTKPHAMVRAVTSREVFPKEEQTIWYTSFDKVNEIKQGDNTITYTYGIDNQRVGMTEIVDGKERVKTYVGSCEFIVEDGVEKALTYLTGPYGVFAIVVEEACEESIHYIYADHIGSWTTITDSIGNVEQRQSFDAWGNRRNAKTWSGPATDEPMFDRGFTGHEHLYAFGLINMNGRMYDPVTSSFLSPDNYVQDPTSQQGFNRYAYCFYNPLKYVDPSGERCYGPSEAEVVQRAINEARQRCWQQIYRMLEEQQLVYQQIKNGQHPFGWGLEPGGIGSENSSKNIVKWSYKRFDYVQLNKGVSSQRGKCVLTSLGSARKCWGEGRWGESTKDWEKREQEYYEQTGRHGYETGNFEDFIESNPDPSRYNTYVAMTGVNDIRPSNICDLMDEGYVVAVFCTLNSGEKHFANVESCTMYDDNSFTIKFSNPNPNMMPPLEISGANGTYKISSNNSDYYLTPRFIAYKLTIWKQ